MASQSEHKIQLSANAHGLVARFAIKNHIMMDAAVETIFLRGLGCVIDEVLEPVQARSGIKECQPACAGEGIDTEARTIPDNDYLTA